MDEDFNPFVTTEEEQNVDLQQVRRQMDDEIVVEMPDAVVETPYEKLGKYRGFQGRSKFGDDWTVPPVRSVQLGDKRWSESQYSIYKQRFLTSFINRQCQPWVNSSQEYIFVDMFGGLGMWTDRFTGDYCAGSPLCIYEALEQNNIDYKGLVFEKDANRASDLKHMLYNKRSNIEVCEVDNAECYAICEGRGYEPSLLYFDYTKQADSDHIANLTRAFPRSDVLIHYSANTYKRTAGSPHCDQLKVHKGNAQYLTYLFNRRYWYINNWDEMPHNKHNFVAIYGSQLADTSPLDENHGDNDILFSYESERI